MTTQKYKDKCTMNASWHKITQDELTMLLKSFNQTSVLKIKTGIKIDI